MKQRDIRVSKQFWLAATPNNNVFSIWIVWHNLEHVVWSNVIGSKHKQDLYINQELFSWTSVEVISC